MKSSWCSSIYFLKSSAVWVRAELVGILAAGEEEHTEAHTLGEQHVGTTQGGVDAGCVTVVDECDVRGETVEHVDLVDAQCRAGVGNDVLDATLVHGDDVGLSFDHVDAVLLGDGTFGLPDAVELMVFVEHLGVGGVDIFLVDTFRTFVEDTCREAHDLTAHACPGGRRHGRRNGR